MYYEIYCDHTRIDTFDREAKNDFIKENKSRYNLLDVLYYNSNHLNVGCETYVNGKLICKYTE